MGRDSPARHFSEKKFQNAFGLKLKSSWQNASGAYIVFVELDSANSQIKNSRHGSEPNNDPLFRDKNLVRTYKPDMEIRPAHEADIPRIRDIYNQAILERSATCDEEPKSLQDRIEWFSQFNEAYPIYVAEIDGVVAGYACLRKYSPKSGYRFAVENSIYIAPEFRGRGLGQKLIEQLISAARERGYKYIEARVFEHNPTSLALHERFGFKRVGVQTNIANLDGKWFSNVILNLHLESGLQNKIERVFSGAPWESHVGYCRAIKNQNFIAVSGTTSFKDGQVFAPGDAYLQTKRCLEIIEEALKKLKASNKNIVRTRMFVTDIFQWEAYGKAHKEVFGDFPPATSMYEVKSLIDPKLLIEIEADAIL
jgi:L-amino acid N-acyltransferase YncA/enamine deaminase RidA (YjgF/YER057c/UK114 family)